MNSGSGSGHFFLSGKTANAGSLALTTTSAQQIGREGFSITETNLLFGKAP